MQDLTERNVLLVRIYTNFSLFSLLIYYIVFTLFSPFGFDILYLFRSEIFPLLFFLSPKIIEIVRKNETIDVSWLGWDHVARGSLVDICISRVGWVTRSRSTFSDFNRPDDLVGIKTKRNDTVREREIRKR